RLDPALLGQVAGRVGGERRQDRQRHEDGGRRPTGYGNAHSRANAPFASAEKAAFESECALRELGEGCIRGRMRLRQPRLVARVYPAAAATRAQQLVGLARAPGALLVDLRVALVLPGLDQRVHDLPGALDLV